MPAPGVGGLSGFYIRSMECQKLSKCALWMAKLCVVLDGVSDGSAALGTHARDSRRRVHGVYCMPAGASSDMRRVCVSPGL